MAKYTGSPYGEISGKFSSSVGGSWKGINWMRQHLIPSNPRSPAQVLTRGCMIEAFKVWRKEREAAFGIQAVKKNLTPSNIAVKGMLPQMRSAGSLTAYVWKTLRIYPILDGYPLTNLASAYDSVAGTMTITWDAEAAPRDADKVYITIRNKEPDWDLIYPGWKSGDPGGSITDQLFKGQATADAGTLAITVPTGLAVDDFNISVVVVGLGDIDATVRPTTEAEADDCFIDFKKGSASKLLNDFPDLAIDSKHAEAA